MKNYAVLALIVTVAIATPNVAAQDSGSTDVQTQPLVTSTGRLQVTADMLNTARPQIYVTQSGLLISPRPADPELAQLWEATQSWVGDNIDRLGQLMSCWQSEASADVTLNRTTYLNQQLQGYLDASGAIPAISYINATMAHQSVTPIDPNDPAMSKPKIQQCGGIGIPMKQVVCCVRSIDKIDGGTEECKLCDCDPNGENCCGYHTSGS